MRPAKASIPAAARSSTALFKHVLGLPVVLVASALMITSGADAKAAIPTGESVAQESVWIVSTRCAPSCGYNGPGEAVLKYWRLDRDAGGNSQWLESDGEEFHEADKSAGPTCFHIHGNRVSHCHAINEGMKVLECLKQQAEGHKFRLVIWSWPSMKIKGGNLKDVRVKAARSDVESYYLARCIRRMDPDAQVSMIGYSFGARIITGALEMLAGGQIAGHRLDVDDENAAGVKSEKANGKLPQIRIMLIASATDRCWFLPGCRNGLALDIIDGAIITCNHCDPVLKHYPKMYGPRGPQAAGYAGPALTFEQRENTEVLNLSCSVGKSHKWNSYLYSPCLYWRLGECVFADDQSAENGE